MNRQQMMQLFAKRLNLSADEQQAMHDGDFHRVAAGRFAADPLMMSMLEMMREQQQAEPLVEVSPRRRAPVEDDEDRAELKMALRASHTTLRYVAQLFGACRCLGQNEACPRCDGLGVPGSRRSSDPETFLAWVRPGLRALGYEIVPASGSPKAKNPTVLKPDHYATED